MNFLRLAILLAVVGLALPTAADTIIVDCNPGGNYDNLPEAVLNAGPDDVVLVMPCVYWAQPGDPYPIALTENSPEIVSYAGAEETVLEGLPGVSLFAIYPGTGGARVDIQGFTIRNWDQPIMKDPAAGGGGTYDFTENIVEYNATGLDASWSVGLIAHNIIRNNGSIGIYVYHFNGTVEWNEVAYNQGSGIVGACCEDPTIEHNHIHHNTGDGLVPGFLYGHGRYNTIEYNDGAGVRAAVIYGGYSHNIIRGNAVGVLACGEIVYINYNDIYSNTSYDFEVHNCGPCYIDATMNWWGTTDPVEIAAHIWDCNDDPALSCCVYFDPWCDAPGCPVTPVSSVSWGAIKALYR